MWGNRGDKMLRWRSPEKKRRSQSEILECGATEGNEMLGWSTKKREGQWAEMLECGATKGNVMLRWRNSEM